MKLSEELIDNAEIKENKYALWDGNGLYMEIKPNGGKYFRIKYRNNGKNKVFSAGIYPKVSLEEARYINEEAKRLLSIGVDPNILKNIAKGVKCPEDLEDLIYINGVGVEMIEKIGLLNQIFKKCIKSKIISYNDDVLIKNYLKLLSVNIELFKNYYEELKSDRKIEE